jgi:hypothetical protein
VNGEATVRTLLADLAGGDPPVGIDVDRQILRGRRRIRHRRLGAAGVAFTAVLAVASGAATLLPRDNSAPLPAATAVRCSLLSHDPRAALLPGQRIFDVSTPRSRALARQLDAQTPGTVDPHLRFGDQEAFDRDCRPQHEVMAGAVHVYRIGGKTYHLSFQAEVAGPEHLPVVSRSACRAPGHAVPGEVCLDVRRLPDGSTAYLIRSRMTAGRFDVIRHSAQILYPDGTQFTVLASVTGAGTNPISAERLLDIARHITVTP